MKTDKGNNTFQALWISIGSLSSFLVAIVSSMILSRYFSKADYGTYRQIVYVYTSLTIIFTAGLPNVFSYFLPRYDLSKGKNIVRRITNILFLSGALFSFFLFIFSEPIAKLLNNTNLSSGLKIFSIVPFLILPTLGIEGIFATYKKTIFIAIYNTVTRILMLLCILIPVIFIKGTIIYAIYGWVIASTLILGIAFLFKSIPFKGIKSEKNDLKMNKILTYSIPIVLSSIWGVAINSSNQFFISRYFGSVKFAEYANGFIQLPFIGMVTGAASSVLMPIFSKMIYNNEDKSQIFDLWKNAIIKSAIIIYPLIIFCIGNAKQIIIILYTKSYLNSVMFFQISLAINIFTFIFFNVFLLSMGKSKLYANVHLIAAISLWCMQYLIIKLFNSPLSIVLIFGLIQILLNTYFLIYISNYFNVKISIIVPFNKILKIFFHSIMILILILFISNYIDIYMNNLLLIFGKFILYIFILITTGRFLKINYLMPFSPILRKYRISAVDYN